MSTYQILGGSGWPQVMKSAIESTDMTSVIYFYSLLFLGNVVLYNLFVAVIIVAFIRQKTKKEDAQRADRMPFLAVYRPQRARVKRGLFGRLSALAKRALASILLCMHAVFPWMRRAHVREVLGSGAAAMEDYRQALALEPYNFEAQDKLRRLKTQ